MVRILVAARSANLQALVQKAIQSDGEAQLAGFARSGAEAVRMAKELRPDVIAMGLRLENPHAATVVKEVMIEAPAPIVMVAHDAGPELGSLSVDALSAGALAVIPAPLETDDPLDEASTRKFLATLKAMSQVKVVRRWRDRSNRRREVPAIPNPASARIVGIIASTGGPAALQSILKSIPTGFPAPILVVQHISEGFIDGVAASLDAIVPLKVKVAEDGELLRPGTVYFAPDNRQLGPASRSRVGVKEAPPVNGFRPSGTYLLDSIAHVFGSESLAVILTGMGSDGIEGLRTIRNARGMAIAQDEASSVVFGMPKAAIDSGHVDLVLPLGKIAPEIRRLAGGEAGAPASQQSY
ncbi:chemotaxis protein CheB [Chelativorans salis]|uniref:Protein-glutamate methylesterase/protein-glutamine glutaminase n=1 Tax=Chelativorans salis TaxID=2978478 RepID=A0ABT2LIH1_9HYPH|nr:chemotaxis protein CheB [Chelativorans sp. EGI FJ00035]MCT7374365.1 chemotaxis protein CheB [Chelativorans sp. EGI FJ00035]